MICAVEDMGNGNGALEDADMEWGQLWDWS